MNKFYQFIKNELNPTTAELYITGDIVRNDDKEWYETWGMECSAPQDFKDSLASLNGCPLTIYIDSYGGDVHAASAIYTAIREYPGKTTVKIDSIAASAASVIAMAGDTVLMSKTAFMVIHDPMTNVFGNISELNQTVGVLKSIKEGLLNAYCAKSHLSREKISKMMTDETWLNFETALEYGFIDGDIENGAKDEILPTAILNRIQAQRMTIYNQIINNEKEKVANYKAACEKRVQIEQENINRYKALLLSKNNKK